MAEKFTALSKLEILCIISEQVGNRQANVGRWAYRGCQFRSVLNVRARCLGCAVSVWGGPWETSLPPRCRWAKLTQKSQSIKDFLPTEEHKTPGPCVH